jgi:hydrogenase maturation protease
MPSEVELIELGVRGIDLVDLIERFDEVLIVDALKSGGRVGDVRIFDHDKLLSFPSSSMLTLHDLGLPVVLKLGEALYGDISSKVKIFGVVVAEIGEMRIGLSASVKRGAFEVVRLVQKEIASLLGRQI